MNDVQGDRNDMNDLTPLSDGEVVKRTVEEGTDIDVNYPAPCSSWLVRVYIPPGAIKEYKIPNSDPKKFYMASIESKFKECSDIFLYFRDGFLLVDACRLRTRVPPFSVYVAAYDVNIL
jgi:hypothetical protein